ncbi:PEP-CTERM sorting domain-containing protein [Cerasicoccus maritimus]|uniref:PEP-CTERM sorting domain-containing protein n=1 Tax=Cerasicoccus maritimus TaxID=490089 RepID=UPI002852AD34|nr:PEP-CTERM sorting domain-containing protein [Cerasicoccus maritimus]
MTTPHYLSKNSANTQPITRLLKTSLACSILIGAGASTASASVLITNDFEALGDGVQLNGTTTTSGNATWTAHTAVVGTEFGTAEDPNIGGALAVINFDSNVTPALDPAVSTYSNVSLSMDLQVAGSGTQGIQMALGDNTLQNSFFGGGGNGAKVYVYLYGDGSFNLFSRFSSTASIVASGTPGSSGYSFNSGSTGFNTVQLALNTDNDTADLSINGTVVASGVSVTDFTLAAAGVRFNAGANSQQIDNFTFAAIPEPSALAAMLGSVAGLAVWLRRKNKIA